MEGATFSEDRKHRFSLWRTWDDSKPKVMFIGLNPSTADETQNDPTIKRVCAIAKCNGFGGVIMMNCFSFISTDPALLSDCSGWIENEKRLKTIGAGCSEIVFAWGNFEIVRRLGIDWILHQHFPKAKALHINKNGSPKHPLYCKVTSPLIPFK